VCADFSRAWDVRRPCLFDRGRRRTSQHSFKGFRFPLSVISSQVDLIVGTVMSCVPLRVEFGVCGLPFMVLLSLPRHRSMHSPAILILQSSNPPILQSSSAASIPLSTLHPLQLVIPHSPQSRSIRRGSRYLPVGINDSTGAEGRMLTS
jgi:hypothetical protein